MRKFNAADTGAPQLNPTHITKTYLRFCRFPKCFSIKILNVSCFFYPSQLLTSFIRFSQRF